MNRYFIAACCMVLSCGVLQVSAQQKEKIRKAHIGLIYPISSNGAQAAEYTNYFSLHAIAGVSGTEKGFAASGFLSVVKDSATSWIMSGFGNIIFNKAKGVQLAGFMNLVKNESQGLQAAGFLNYSGSSKGTQLAGFGNYVRREAGVQVAGFFNRATDVTAQVGGFINIAKKVKGVQIGVINIAESANNPVGIVNIIKNGEKMIGITYDETSSTLVTFRSGGSRLYGILGVGANFKTPKTALAVEAGIGAHFPASDRFRINLEVASQNLEDFEKGEYMKASFRVLSAIGIGERLEVFAGPSFNYTTYTNGRGEGVRDHYMWSEVTRSGRFNGMHIGATLGAQWRLP